MRSRPVLIGVVALALSLVAAACGSDSSSSRAETLTVMLDWTPNTHHIGLYVARAEGWFADAGLDVEIVENDSGGVEQAVASGRADIGISTSEALLPARAEGVPLVSIATVAPHNYSSLMSLSETGISRPRDLEDKTYGGYGGALETELLDQLVTCDGGDFSKVKTTEVGDVDYLAGLDQGRFDFVWVFSGWDGVRASQIEGASIDELAFQDNTDCIPDWYTPIYVASESTLADHPDAVRAFLSVVARGYDLAVADPTEAATLMHEQVPESDLALLEASAGFYSTRFVAPDASWGVQDPTVWSEFEAFARQAGLIAEPVEVDEAFTNDYLPAE